MPKYAGYSGLKIWNSELSAEVQKLRADTCELLYSLMTRLSTLLLAVDASPYAEAAAHYAAFFSRQLKLPVEVLHVLDSRAAGTPAPFDAGMDDTTMMTPQFDASLQEVLEARADELKVHMDDLLKRLRLSAEVGLASGSPAGAILERADAHTLSVLGQEGEAAELGGNPRLGSVAERVLRRTEGTVLLVPRHFFKPERVVLGYDGSAGAEAALTYTLKVAQLLNVPVLALNAHEDEAAAQKQLDTVRARAEHEGLRLETEYRYGNPSEAILSATHEGDLLAIGAFGSGRVAEFFRGSTTSSVVRRANVPVLLHH